MSGKSGIYRYNDKSFTIWFSTMQTWFLPIFMSRIPKSGFLSGCPVFQKVHIWNLHVMGSFRIQKFFRTNLVRDPVLLQNLDFLSNFRFFNIFYNFFKSGKKAILWQNRKLDQFCLGNFLHSEASRNMLIPIMDFLKNRTTGQITGFRVWDMKVGINQVQTFLQKNYDDKFYKSG